MRFFPLLSLLLMSFSVFATEPIRLFVDKVFSRNNDKIFAFSDFRSIRDSGFNVVCCRWNGDDHGRNAEYAAVCQELGMRYVPWLRGTHGCDDVSQQLVFENGVRIPIAAPLSDVLWTHFKQSILPYVRISRQQPALMGVFLDFEVYSDIKYSNAYTVSYDDQAFKNFFQSRKLPMPELETTARYQYLREQNLVDAFTDWTAAQFRRRCQELRVAIDRLNPDFQLVIYNGDALVSNIFVPAMGTSRAPVVRALSDTYGPPCTMLPEEDNIKMCRELFRDRLHQSAPDSVYLAGLCPPVPGCIPEFAGRLAVAASQMLGGYWVFYEGFIRTSPKHDDYMRHFTLANQAIVNQNWDYADEKFATTALEKMEIPASDGRPTAALFGAKAHLHATLEKLGWQSATLTRLEPQTLAQFDLVILQNLNAIAPSNSVMHQVLRDYVEQGGGLLLAHDTGWYVRELFPEIAERGFPRQKVSAVRHVLDLDMVVTDDAGKILPECQPGTNYLTAFADHAIFVPGQKGVTLVKNRFDEAVIVAGQSQNGRVAYAGNYFAYRQPLQGQEEMVFKNLIEYLTRRKNANQ